MIAFRDFPFDPEEACPCIYRHNGQAKPHRVTNRGVVIGPEVAGELARFLQEFTDSLPIRHQPYYRLDAYFDTASSRLTVLEANACFVDGWGTGLNLTRLAGVDLTDRQKMALVFPLRFGFENADYLPELELMTCELALLDPKYREAVVYDDWREVRDEIYVYGRAGTEDNFNVLPRFGVELDHKSRLGAFSRRWDGEHVRLPRYYTHPEDQWGALPKRFVLKYHRKADLASLAQGRVKHLTKSRARSGVLFVENKGNHSAHRLAYEQGRAFAQERISPAVDGRNYCQLIILCYGATPIAGYTQYGSGWVITDDSLHGPLQLCF